MTIHQFIKCFGKNTSVSRLTEVKRHKTKLTLTAVKANYAVCGCHGNRMLNTRRSFFFFFFTYITWMNTIKSNVNVTCANLRVTSDYLWSNKRRKRTEQPRGASVPFTGLLAVNGNMTEFELHAPRLHIGNAPVRTSANQKPARWRIAADDWLRNSSMKTGTGTRSGDISRW